MTRAARRFVTVACVTGGAIVPLAAQAQSFDIEHPCTLRTGHVAGIIPTDRRDGARSGVSPVRLPAAGLRMAWRTLLGFTSERAPLVGPGPTVYAIGTRGEVAALGADGQERWRVETGMAQPGPPGLLADDTVVFVDAAGEAVGVRDGRLRWRTRFGRSGGTRPAPLVLDDGGAIVATAREISLIDADGRERGRATLREPIVGPLLSALGQVIAVTTAGAIWSWTPGANEALRAGSFGSPVDGGAALLDDHTLVAVRASGLRLLTYDLKGRESGSRGANTAAIWGGPPTVLRGAMVLRAYAQGEERIVSIDATGAESGRAVVGRSAPPAGAAAPPGAAVPIRSNPTALIAVPAAAHTPPWIDMNGVVAFASADGSAGVVTGLSGSQTVVERVPDVCPTTQAVAGSGGAPAIRESDPAAGLAPVAPGAFVVLCRSASAVLLVRSTMTNPMPTGEPNP